MTKILLYPHGLGDCILATPALREYKKQGNYVSIAIQRRFKSAELFDGWEYVDEIQYVDDPWNDYKDFETGLKEIMYNAAKLGNYDEIQLIRHSPSDNKINDVAEALGVKLTNVHTEVSIKEWHIQKAKEILSANGINQEEQYGFIHSKTGVPAKDLPDGFGQHYLEKLGCKKFIEIGKSYDQFSVPIGVGFALLNMSNLVIVADSVYYHAAGALEKPVTLAYFGKGKQVYQRVRPLHETNQRIVYNLEGI